MMLNHEIEPMLIRLKLINKKGKNMLKLSVLLNKLLL